MKGISRVVWLTRILPFISLDQSMKVGQTCLYFNQLTRSPLFVKLQVSMNERTKIDVSLDTFGNNMGSSVNLFQSQLQNSRGLSSDLENERQRILSKGGAGRTSGSKAQQHEDKEAELETLRSVKVFLTEKLK